LGTGESRRIAVMLFPKFLQTQILYEGHLFFQNHPSLLSYGFEQLSCIGWNSHSACPRSMIIVLLVHFVQPINHLLGANDLNS
jgi:hypothetical protein